MRRGYCLQEHDKEKLTPIMEGIIYRLEMGDLDDIELSIINLGPSQFMQLLENEDIKLNNESLQYKMHGYNDFESYYIFTYYSSENDEGVWCTLGKGVPEGSKLYYVKMWDENDNLVYLGAASKALNPKTNQEEYCWRSYCQGANNYEFAYHPESETLSYVPYGGGID